MKKLSAVLLAFSMIFAFAACGEKTEEPTEPTTAEDLFAAFEEETTETPAVDATEAPAVDATQTSSTEETQAETQTETTAVEITQASKGLNSTDIEEIVAYYNAARKATSPAPAGQSKLTLVGDVSGEGAIGTFLEWIGPAAKDALARKSQPTDYIPANGHADILASDVTKAQASSKNGVTTIVIQLKEQVDGSNGDTHDGGPVARGVGTLGSIDIALEELGAELTDGKDTVSLTYTDAYIKCTIDENTGMITGGTWHHTVKVHIGKARGQVSILSANLTNIKATVDYRVDI